MENCAKDIALDPSMFSVNPEPMRFIPQSYFEVNPFGASLGEWAQMPPEVTLPVLRLLDGKPMVCHGNHVVAFVHDGSPDCANKSDEELVKFWFTENPKFGVAVSPKGMGVGVHIVPGSVRLVKSEVCIEKKWKENGFYRKLTLEFDTVFRCWEPVRDLSEADLAKPFIVKQFDITPRDNKKWLRALKAVLMRPGQVYIGESDRFIMRIPRNLEDGSQIVGASLDGLYSMSYSNLAQFCEEFSPSAEQRDIVGKDSGWFHFRTDYGKCRCVAVVGNLAHEGFGQVAIRIPLVETYPKLFVKNVRRGLAACTEYVERCVSQGKLEMVSLKFGCFEFQVRISVNPWVGPSPRQMLASMAEIKESEPQWSDIEKVEAASVYLSKLREYLTALADFAEMLLNGSDDIEAIRKNLNTLVINEVQLDPLSYVENGERAVREFASYCISGEWVTATQL